MTDRGLREIVAAQTRLSDIDGQAGRLWYVGYDIHDLAGRTSYEEVVHLLHELRLPNQAELDALTRLHGRGARGLEVPPGPDAHAGAADLADVDAPHERVGRLGLRPGRVGRLGGGRPSQGAASDRQDPDPARDVPPVADGSGDRAAEHEAPPRGELPPHAARPRAVPGGRRGDRHDVRALRRPHDERLDVHGADRGLDAGRHVLGDHRGDRRAQGTAARRRQRGVDEDARGDRRRRTAPRRTCETGSSAIRR